ncbi:hypothetical protein P3S68_003305 [Capsicum galapagoense]
MVSQYSKGFICLIASFMVICPQAYQIVHNFKYCLYQIVSLMDQYMAKLEDLSNLQQSYLGTNHFTALTLRLHIFNISSLQILSLWKNNLSGFLPREIGNLTKMQILQLSGNKLIGKIPKEISNLVELEKLDLSLNSFSGPLDMEIFNISRLRIIELSLNNLSGSLPPNMCSILPNIEELFLGGLTNLVGTIPHSISNCSKLTKLELSDNKLTGLIPNSLGYLTNLQFLNLGENNFTSDSSLSFLTSLTNCKNLTDLYLPFNPLNGMLPASTGNLSISLRKFYAGNCKIKGRIPNELYGEIPSGGPFKNLSSDFFIDNEALCGSSRFNVPPCPTSSKHRSNRKKLLLSFLLLSIAVVFVPMTFVLLWIRYRRGKSVPQQADLLSTISRERISYYELLRATNALSESNQIGSGSFGSVYKGILRSGTAIAVKVFNLQLDAAFKTFDTECEVFCSLLHRNLVKVITSCSNLDFKALVLAYMPNGSLEKYLYSHNYFLDTKKRLSIMIDVACALEYLHRGCSLLVIHCDVKPSNVLLYEDMAAHLSDFDIAKLLGEDEEYGLDGLVSTKCDVYSYAVLFLETFTRRKPNEFEGDLSLKQWVSYSLPGAVMDVVDSNLVTQTGSRLQMELDVVGSIMKVAIDCCAESPARRTNMKDVVGMLQKINIQLLAC